MRFYGEIQKISILFGIKKVLYLEVRIQGTMLMLEYRLVYPHCCLACRVVKTSFKFSETPVLIKKHFAVVSLKPFGNLEMRVSCYI